MKLVGRLSYGPDVAFSSIEITLQRIPEQWRCLQCGSAFIKYIVSEQVAIELYTLGNSSDRWSGEPFSERKPNAIVQELRRRLKSHTLLLDIGANTGELLDFAASCGCICSGVEFSAESRRILEEKGYSTFAQMPQTESAFDIITAFDLVEHLYNAPVFFDKCARLLRPNGYLIILTGNIESLGSRLAQSHWWYLQFPEHIVFPSEFYLSRLNAFSLEKTLHTYASVEYNRSYIIRIYQYIRALREKRIYDGLPSPSADHMLCILQRR